MMDKKVQTLAAHPAAEAYRLMTEDELAELAASIAEHGLRDPITVGFIGAQRWIVDGRNRERACEIAGVPREYEEIEFANEDELRAFVADRNERRNITAGQKAMAHAILFPREKGGRGKKLSGKDDSLSQGHWKNLVAQARTVIEYAPTLVENVRDGGSLDEAYGIAMTAKRAPETDGAMRQKLARERDLLALVQDGKISLREAVAALDERQRQRAVAIAQGKRAADEGFSGFFTDIVTIMLAMNATEEPIISRERIAEAHERLKKLETFMDEKGR
jgi:ParB-like nuclease domain